MYSYHNRIKQRISNRELINYEYVQEYKGISPCLLLHFETEPKVRPIREHRFEMYETMLNKKAQPYGVEPFRTKQTKLSSYNSCHYRR